MKILGPDSLIFGVDDVAACNQYLTDYGLEPSETSEAGGTFSALDGTSIIVRHKQDPSQPPALETGSALRKTLYGVADTATLGLIRTELERDRHVTQSEEGSIESVDDMGFVIGFQVTQRKPINLPAERINAPGDTPHRPANVLGVDEAAKIHIRSLSHVVYFVPDAVKAEAFYVKRLGFRTTDTLTGAGPFLQPAASLDHHTLFLIQTPPFLKGVEHFTFHVGGPTELMHAGSRFSGKGYQSFWGPGRHKFGSNWFWYFNSPFGCHVEYDADMDIHDANWQPRVAPMSADTSQLFLFQHREKWAPGGPPPPVLG